MNITNIRTFLPSIDFESSKQFYLDLGFTIQWEGEDLIIFGTKSYNFFLQKYYNKDWAENLMMQLHVTDIEEVYAVFEKVYKKYEGCKIKPIFTADYGRTFHLIGPAGELWHITETMESKEVEENKLLCEDQ